MNNDIVHNTYTFDHTYAFDQAINILISSSDECFFDDNFAWFISTIGNQGECYPIDINSNV